MSRNASVIPAFTATALLTLAAACASPPEPAPVAATPFQPDSGEVIELDHLLLVVDASASILDDTLFPEEKVLVTAYVDSMPGGSYETGSVSFGGFDRHRQRLSPFARSQLRAQVSETRHLREGTPLHRVFEEEIEVFKGRSGRAAVVVFTDGLVTDEFGRDIPSERALTAASELAKAYGGTMCFHAVQLGEEVAGGEFLRSLSEVTDCGSLRSASATSNEAALHAFQREVFVADAAGTLPPVAAAPPARCPGTPAGVPVDRNGCWEIPEIGFAFDSAVIEPSYEDELEGIARTLEANPQTRLVIDGYTDSMGDPAYNRQLSLQRAQATKDALVSSGIDADRLEVNGRGAENPLHDNDSLANRQANRRSHVRIDR